jgi:hypothetical protein
MNNLKTNFFESVAAHNLERFHSETIAWIFNTFPEVAKVFIKNISKDKKLINEKINIDKCEAEIGQIDIKLDYNVNGIKHSIFIENKLKATEHKISHKIWSKNLLRNIESDFLNKYNEEEKDLSQTEYYFLKEQGHLPNNNFQFVYLVPNKADQNNGVITNAKSDIEKFYNFNQLNSWTLPIDNPWMTITYLNFATWVGLTNLFSTSNEINKTIALGYIDYLKSGKFSEYLDLNNFENNIFGKFEYFKFLQALIKSKIVSNYNHSTSELNVIHEYIQAGSSNGGMPLFAFYKRIPVGNKFTYFDVPTSYINIGIQVQGDSFKYYVSVDVKEYDNVKVINQQDYKKFVENILNSISENNSDFKSKEKGFNPNKTKSFYSRSYKIKNFIDIVEQPRDIFDISSEISEKVNHFANLDILQFINLS